MDVHDISHLHHPKIQRVFAFLVLDKKAHPTHLAIKRACPIISYSTILNAYFLILEINLDNLKMHFTMLFEEDISGLYLNKKCKSIDT